MKVFFCFWRGRFQRRGGGGYSIGEMGSISCRAAVIMGSEKWGIGSLEGVLSYFCAFRVSCYLVRLYLSLTATLHTATATTFPPTSCTDTASVTTFDATTGHYSTYYCSATIDTTPTNAIDLRAGLRLTITINTNTASTQHHHLSHPLPPPPQYNHRMALTSRGRR